MLEHQLVQCLLSTTKQKHNLWFINIFYNTVFHKHSSTGANCILLNIISKLHSCHCLYRTTIVITLQIVLSTQFFISAVLYNV